MSDKTQHQQSLDKYFESEEDFDFSEPKKKPIKKEEKAKDDEEDDDDKKTKKKDDEQDEEFEGDEIFDDFKNEIEDDDENDEDSKPDKTGKDKPGDKQVDKPAGKKKGKEDDEEGEEEEREETDVQFYTNLAKELKKKGVLSSIEITDKDEIDEDRFFELQDEELDARLDEEIETLFKGMNPDAAAHIKHLKNGGRTQDFLKVYGQPTFKEDLDLTVDKNRKLVIKTYLREVEGLDDEELEERMEYLKDGAKEEKYAKRYHNWFVETEKQNKIDLQNRTLKAKDKAIYDAKKFKSDIEEFISSNEEAAGIPIPQKDKKKLAAFITDASVKTQQGFRTNFQLKIDALYKTDEKLVAFAYMLMNDFKLNAIKQEGKTEQVKKIREVLSTGRDSRKTPSSTNSRRATNTIADLIG